MSCNSIFNQCHFRHLLLQQNAGCIDIPVPAYLAWNVVVKNETDICTI